MTNLNKMAGMTGSKLYIDMQTQVRHVRQRAYEHALEQLLKETVRLAIVRSDLRDEEGFTLGEDMTDDRAREIAQDAAQAMQGEGTCDDKPAEEWKTVISLALDSWPALFERVERKIAEAMESGLSSHSQVPVPTPEKEKL
jgi:hypothetical protein